MGITSKPDDKTPSEWASAVKQITGPRILTESVFNSHGKIIKGCSHANAPSSGE